MDFLEYELRAEILCMGERMKAGWFRPCVRTIPYSQITGALRRAFGQQDLHAVGRLCEVEGCNLLDYLTYAPRDRLREVSKIPLRIEVLHEVLGLVYVLGNEAAKALPKEMELSLGALVSKGLGRCRLERVREVSGQPTDKPGILTTRLPLERKDIFNIRRVLMPVLGYLFRPTSPYTGEYVLSLFEGSKVVGPAFLLKEKVENGRSSAGVR